MGQKLKHFFAFFSSASHNRTLSLISVLVVAAMIPLTVQVLNQQQEIRQRASENDKPLNLRLYCVRQNCTEVKVYWDPPPVQVYWYRVQLFKQGVQSAIGDKWMRSSLSATFPVTVTNTDKIWFRVYAFQTQPPFSCNLETNGCPQGDPTVGAWYNASVKSFEDSIVVTSRTPNPGEAAPGQGPIDNPSNLNWSKFDSTSIKLTWNSVNNAKRYLVRGNGIEPPLNSAWTHTNEKILDVPTGNYIGWTVQAYGGENPNVMSDLEAYWGAPRSDLSNFSEIDTRAALTITKVEARCHNKFGYTPRIFVSWPDQADESKGEYYKVLRKDGNSPTWIVRSTLTGNRTHFNDSSFTHDNLDSLNGPSPDQNVRGGTLGLQLNTTYSYKIEVAGRESNVLEATTDDNCGPNLTVDFSPANACTDTNRPIVNVSWRESENQPNESNPLDNEYYKVIRQERGGNAQHRANLKPNRAHFNDNNTLGTGVQNGDQTVISGSPGLKENTEYTYWIEVEDVSQYASSTPLRVSNHVTGRTASCQGQPTSPPATPTTRPTSPASTPTTAPTSPPTTPPAGTCSQSNACVSGDACYQNICYLKEDVNRDGCLKISDCAIVIDSKTHSAPSNTFPDIDNNNQIDDADVRLCYERLNQLRNAGDPRAQTTCRSR